MKNAYLQANEGSKDPSTKIGAVIIKEDTIISTGYNGFPRKVKDYESRYLDKEIKYKLVVHAEQNAIFSAARNGAQTLNTILYTQAHPCSECCKAIAQAGIKEVVIHERWKMNHSIWAQDNGYAKLILEEAKIPVRQIYEKLGVCARINGITQIL
jgi:dCMP deaminase